MNIRPLKRAVANQAMPGMYDSSGRELYDPYQRAVAARLEAEHYPRWVIWWGVGSRRFWAVPCWKGAAVSIVDAADERELLVLMRRVEAGLVPFAPRTVAVAEVRPTPPARVRAPFTAPRRLDGAWMSGRAA